jgi:hypothetical protein
MMSAAVNGTRSAANGTNDSDAALAGVDPVGTEEVELAGVDPVGTEEVELAGVDPVGNEEVEIVVTWSSTQSAMNKLRSYSVCPLRLLPQIRCLPLYENMGKESKWLSS